MALNFEANPSVDMSCEVTPANSSAPIATSEQPVDCTAHFNDLRMDFLEKGPANSIDHQILDVFLKEAYQFKYDALLNGYEPEYVLSIFPDHQFGSLEWAMTVFKLPPGFNQVYGCECVKITELWELKPNLIFECALRKDWGLFYLDVYAPTASDEVFSDEGDDEFDDVSDDDGGSSTASTDEQTEDLSTQDGTSENTNCL